MKYVVIPFIALGLSLSMVYGVEYDCEGSEPFSTYYGSPFVFKKSSLGSSMEYFYSIFGLFLNVVVWSAVLFLLRFGIKIALELARFNLYLKMVYQVVVLALLVFTFLNLFMFSLELGDGFAPDMNYWYWNFDQEVRDYGMQCNGTWQFFTP
jgi:hypothetical protein